MKKTFTKLFAALALLVFMMPTMAGWGQTKTETVTTYNWITNANWTDANNSWTCNKAGQSYQSSIGGGCVQVTANASYTGAGATSKNSFSNITKISVNAATTSKGVGNITISVGGGTAQTICSLSTNSKFADYDLKFATPVSGTVTFVVNCSTNSMYMHSISITTTDNGGGGTTHNITINSMMNGTVQSSHETAAQGVSVTLTPQPATNYVLGSMDVIGQGSTSYQLTNNNNGTWSFTMPDEDVYVGATFLPATTVTIDDTYLTNTDLQNGPAAGSLSASVKENVNNTNISGATVTWASSNTDVATVDQTGAVTLVAVGTTNITATYAGDQTYATSSDTYQLTVVDNTPSTGTDVTFTAGTETGTSSGNNSPDEMQKGGVTVYGSDAAFATAQYRLYSGSTTTISVAAGYTITKIIFDGGNNTSNHVSRLSVASGSTGSYTTNNNVGTWIGDASSVAFNANGQARVASIVVTIESTGSTPTISASPSTLNTFSCLSTSTDPSAAQSVAVTGANLTDDITASVGANSVFEISTAENGTYTNSLTLAESNGEVSTTIWVRMKANQTGNPTGTLTLSSTGATSVTIALNGSVVTPMSVADAIDAIDNAANHNVADAYVTGIVSSIVTAYDSQFSNVTFDMVDAVGDQAYLRAYRCGGNDAAYVAVGDVVVVSGSMTLYNNSIYEFNQGCQIVSRTPHQAQQYTLEVTSVSHAGIEVFDATDPDDNNWVSLFEGEDAAQVTEGTPIALSVSAEEGYAISELMVNDVNHVDDIEGGLYTFNMPAQNVTITVTAVSVYNITYSENGVETQAQVLSNTLTLPVGEDLDSEFSFAGWTTTPANIDTPMAAGAQVTIQGDEIFYAVYARIEGREAYYEKVTEDLQDWRGNYLIVQEYESVAFDGSLTELDGGHNVIGVTISNGIINSDDDVNGSIFTIDTYENGYSIQSASGYYIGKTAYSNGLNSSDATAYENTISYNDENECVNILGSASNTVALRFNNASGVSNYRFRYYKDYSQQPIQLYKEVVVSLGTTTYYTRVFVNETVTDKVTITGPSIIPSGKTLDMGENVLTNNLGYAKLIIEDGGQLNCPNAVVATIKKNIDKAWDSENKTGWYTISTPTSSTGFGDVENLKPMDGDNRLYDIYRYKESTMTWENSIGAGFDDDMFEEGRGYLYRKGDTDALEFAGTINVAESYKQSLTVDASVEGLRGFALLGNPYSHNITLKHVVADGNTLDACYVLTGEDAWTTKLTAENDDEIAPCQGFLVQATTAGDAYIHKTAQSSKGRANNDYIKFIVANNQYEDVTFALFDEGHGLNKINHRNSNIQQIYIPKDGESFAVATMADNTQSFNLNFKAMTMGQYKLSFKTKGEFNYLHVIDRMTGEDIDMLLEGEYSFIGSPQDSEARFIVHLGYLPNYDNNGEDIFAYQNGSDIIVSGEGELQIFDVIGRMVSTQNVNGTELINVNAQGVYVLRLVGTDIKTQKIVVR